MPPDLKSAYWKIDRAIELLDALDKETVAWFNTVPPPAGYYIEIDPKHTRIRVIVRVSNPPDTVRWALIFADIIHNLRCALDHAFWALLEEEFSTGLPKGADKLTFPIWDSPPNSNQRKPFKPIGDKLLGAVESVQPYNHPTSDFPVHPLAIIRDIDNGNKHRLLFSLMLSMGRINIKISQAWQPQSNSHIGDVYRGVLQDGIEVYAISFDVPEPDIKYECTQFMAIIAVRHPNANRLGQDRDDYARLVDDLIGWVRNTINGLVAAAYKGDAG